MASYLFPYREQTIRPYESPIELYGAALQYKNAKFAQGLANIRSHYDAVLNTPLTNEENQQALRSGVNAAMNRLSKLSVNDVSLPENQGQINSLFDSILDNPDIMYDAAWTRGQQKQIRKAEDLQKKDPSLVPPQNLEPLYLAQEQFRTAPGGSRPTPVKFTPYYDFDKKMTESLDKVKSDVDVMFSKTGVKVEGPDGNFHDVSIDGQYTVEQLKDYTVSKLVSQRLASDPQALTQMSLDYQYNTRNGIYPASSAITGIDSEISTNKSMSSAIEQALSMGVSLNNQPLTANERKMYKEQQQVLQNDIERLNGLRNEIKADPSKSNKWFTFDHHAKAYIQGKVDQYAYSKKSLLSSVPGVNELNQYRYDVWKEQWKAKLEIDKAKAGVGKSGSGKTDEIPYVPVPYNNMLTRLDTSPGGIPATQNEFQALGQMHKDKDGRLFMNFSFDGTNADNTLIFTPASGSLSKAQMKTVDSATMIGAMDRELNNLAIPRPKNDVSTMTDPETGQTISIENTAPLTAKELTASYQSNPNASDPKVKAVIEKYTALMSKYNLNPVNDRDKVQSELDKDPTLTKSVQFGSNIKINGRYEVVPAQGDNIVLGENGKMYMKGSAIIPHSQLKEIGIGSLKSNDVVKTWEIVEQRSSGDDPKDSRYEKAFKVPVYIPVNGDPVQINDRMLDVENYQQQWGKDAPEMRNKSKQEVLRLSDAISRSTRLPNDRSFIVPGKEGNYRVDWISAPSASQIKSYGDILQITNDIATRTGRDQASTLQQVTNIFGVQGTALQRQLAIDALSNTPGVQNLSDLNTRAARNNNPLNIKDDAVGGIRSTGKDNENHAIFGTVQEGLMAGFQKIQNIYTGTSTTYSPTESLQSFSSKYATSPNDLTNLLSSLKQLGFNATGSTKVSQVPIALLFEALIMKEDGQYYNYLKASNILNQFLSSK